MSGNRGRRQRANAEEDARFAAFTDANTGWGDQPDRRLIPGQTMQVPLDAAGPQDVGAETRLRVRCRECGGVLGIVFDWSTTDGEVVGRKLVVNGGHALLDAEALDHRFAFSCCSWSATRTGDELNKKLGTMQLP